MQKLTALELGPFVDVRRAKSGDVDAPDGIGLLVVDGNHGPDAIADVEKWAPHVVPNGVVFLDDLDWTGGAVREAAKRLEAMGFTHISNQDTGAFYERRATT